MQQMSGKQGEQQQLYYKFDPNESNKQIFVSNSVNAMRHILIANQIKKVFSYEEDLSKQEDVRP
jgi:hypothetical protein